MRASDLESRFPGVKTRIFSTYPDSLEIIQRENFKFKGKNLQQRYSTMNRLIVPVVSCLTDGLLGTLNLYSHRNKIVSGYLVSLPSLSLADRITEV